MVLLHKNDCHFNLVISEDSDLAKFGSLSHRFADGPIDEVKENHKESNCNVNDEDKTNDERIDTDNSKQKDDELVKKLKGELKKCKESKEYIENEYFKCESELSRKTEEVEKIKIEVKDLRKIIDFL